MGLLGTVFISGANRGIGLELVRQLIATPGNRVFAACRNPAKASELQELAKAHEKSLILVELDVTNDAQIEKAVEVVTKAAGDTGIQVLFNNAGILNDGSFKLDQTTRELINECLNTNVTSQLMMSKAFRKLLVKGGSTYHGAGKHSVIINFSSEMGSITNASTGAYGYRASKTALNMISKALAGELTPEGIYAIAIHPGWVQTDMGGSKAPTKVEDSVAGIINLAANLTESQNGKFLDFTGKQREY